MLPCSGFCDEFFLAHFFRKESFSETMIDLVCTRMIEVFTLQIYLCTAEFRTHIRKMINRRWTTSEVFVEISKFADEVLIVFDTVVCLGDFLENRFEWWWDKSSSIISEVSMIIRKKMFLCKSFHKKKVKIWNKKSAKKFPF